ncbi:nuclear RNA export factor 1 isoform X2 [Oncorhynchus mykiss]|uniref:nuclear RNA export factor 1 isoform X2 n=1 Tax=Oncorhynchus mykiss TaxID=8022 RepID=UPI001877FAA4|nr:nuclear RNA export factor 1 isoform X2 [Oncorhynchus mykiss]
MADGGRFYSDQEGVVFQRDVTRKGKLPGEHDNRVAGPQFRGGRMSRGPIYYDSPARQQRPRGGQMGGYRGPGPGPRVRFEDNYVDVTMNSGSPQDGSSHRRFNPYRWPNRRGDGQFDRDRRGAGGYRGEGGGGREGGGGGKDKSSWYKMIIPYGRKYDKKWLLTALQNLCSVPFTPVQYQIEGHKAQFYLEDACTAKALCRVSRQITDTEGYKVIVLMNPCPPPAILNTQLKPEDMEHLKQCMAKRFDGSQRALDLNNIRTDPDLVSQNIRAILSRKTFMDAVVKIIEENIPELVCLNLSNNKLYKLEDVADLISKAPHLKILNLSHNELKSEKELDRLKGLKLVELWLDRNPLCDQFKDQLTYISAIRERFPRLLKLDGHDLPPPIVFEVVSPTTTPPCKGSYFGSEEIKVLIMHFLQQYYSVYDSGNRQPLLDAYHDGASFSLSLPSSQNPNRSLTHISPSECLARGSSELHIYLCVFHHRCSLREYHKDSRNIKRLKDPSTRFRLLKHTRLNVVALLNELPKTQHDSASFNVDVNTYTTTLLSFTVSGMFKEVDGKSEDAVRAFSRVFIAVPAGISGLCIVNDELFVRIATTEEIQHAFAASAPTPSSSPVPTLTAPQQEMLSAFSLKSGMNLEWSQKCLQDNEWDFNKAAQIFTQLKIEGKIPDVAFIK